MFVCMTHTRAHARAHVRTQTLSLSLCLLPAHALHQQCQRHVSDSEHGELDVQGPKATDMQYETLLQFTYEKLGIANAVRDIPDDSDADLVS